VAPLFAPRRLCGSGRTSSPIPACLHLPPIWPGVSADDSTSNADYALTERADQNGVGPAICQHDGLMVTKLACHRERANAKLAHVRASSEGPEGKAWRGPMAQKRRPGAPPTCPHVTPGLQRIPHDLMAHLCPIALNPTIRSKPYRHCSLNSSQLFGHVASPALKVLRFGHSLR
jgi:hypothetical protein